MLQVKRLLDFTHASDSQMSELEFLLGQMLDFGGKLLEELTISSTYNIQLENTIKRIFLVRVFIALPLTVTGNTME